MRLDELGRTSIDPRSAATEARLLQGTLRCLRERGVAGTTSRDIAAAAGVNLAAITYHFGSKDELVARALLHAVRAWLEPARQALARDGDPAAKALEAIALLRRSFGAARDLLPAYFEALVRAPRDDVLWRGVDELLGELRALLRDQIQDQKDHGLLPGWVEPDAMATLLLALADGIALHAALNPEAIDHDAIAMQVAQLLLAARLDLTAGGLLEQDP
ncbi:MAG TPA: TetR/AcrR family transcriptional regulator [Actinomycetes bacterium]|nr:TetR/AcrR family transcriptional regulator [Actinomycetes bacterium]